MNYRHFVAASALGLAMAVSASAHALTTFSYSGVIIQWVAPTTGLYAISAIGAQGGHGSDTTAVGGRGAEIQGDLSLDAGTILFIAVGGEGDSGHYNGGGGGGSFVVSQADAPLIIAGGGGGARQFAAHNGFDANVGQSGLTGSGSNYNGAGGGIATNQLGLGGGAPEITWGSAGGGFYTNGASDPAGYGTGGSSWFNGLAGGVFLNSCTDGNGGFGGGGAGAGCAGGGGGGGYSGGDGGLDGGGGGSYLSGLATNGNLQAGVGYGDGEVTIDLLTSGVPEPATWAMMVCGFGGLGALMRYHRTMGERVSE
jgi:hypothetical protein